MESNVQKPEVAKQASLFKKFQINYSQRLKTVEF